MRGFLKGRKYLLSAFLSTIFLYILSIPMYVFWLPVLYPLLIVNYSLAYLLTIMWQYFFVYVVLLLLCLPGLSNSTYTLILIVVYNALAYLLAGFIGSGWDRVRSVVVFWIVMQVAEILVSYLSWAVGYTGGDIHPPRPIEGPFYFIAYFLVSLIHLKYGNKKSEIDLWAIRS